MADEDQAGSSLGGYPLDKRRPAGGAGGTGEVPSSPSAYDRGSIPPGPGVDSGEHIERERRYDARERIVPNAQAAPRSGKRRSNSFE